jgi:hypothetical protein
MYIYERENKLFPFLASFNKVLGPFQTWNLRCTIFDKLLELLKVQLAIDGSVFVALE